MYADSSHQGLVGICVHAKISTVFMLFLQGNLGSFLHPLRNSYMLIIGRELELGTKKRGLCAEICFYLCSSL